MKKCFYPISSAIVALAVLFVFSCSALAQFRTITVQNAPSNPVPTQAQGTTVITGDVNATITNTPAVALSGTPSVNVANTPTVTVSGTPSVNVANAPIVFLHDDPGRIAYQSTVDNTGKCPPGGTICFWQFGTVPAGHRVVIQHISGLVGYSSSSVVATVFLTNGGAPLSVFLAPGAGALFTAFDQPVLVYYDAFQSITAQVNLANGSFPNPADSISELIVLKGYELDCTAAPCAPIAH